MTITPEVWLASVTANAPLDAGTLHGILFTDPQITTLSDGNILVTWATNKTSGVSSPAGADIVGQIFDVLGNKAGGEILLNQSFNGNDESSPSIAAMPGGGFIVAYSDVDAGVTSIRLDEYNNFGQPVSSNATVISDSLTAVPNFSSPAIAAASDTSVMIVYEKEVSSGNANLYFKIYNPATNTYGAESAMMISDFSIGSPAVTVLSNGNYAIAADDDKLTPNSSIAITIFDSAGSLVAGAQSVGATELNNNLDSDASITALRGGGFVVSWTSDVNGSGALNSDIKFQLFDANGSAIGSVQTVNGTGANANNDESSVVPLYDGGFIVIYDNDENSNQITAQRYDSSGNAVGNEFDIDAGGHNTGPQATLLADGRVAVTFFGQDAIQMQIIDPRTSVNLNGVATSNYVVGTVGADTLFTQTATSSWTFGWDGDDIMGIDGTISAIDVFDGGNGADTFSMFSQVSDVDINLTTGRVRLLGDTDGARLYDFENIMGGAGDDLLTGNSLRNDISGGAGRDAIYGEGGRDILTGMDGNDSIYGGRGNDVIRGNTGADLLLGGRGNDRIIGGGGQDNLQGGTGRDKLIGGGGKDVLNGGAGEDILKGGGGDDVLRGGRDADTLLGGSGNDRLEGGLGNDQLVGGSGFDVFVFRNVPGEGVDTIRDYNDVQDRIDLQAFNFASFADVEARASQVGASLQIDFGGGDMLVIENFLLADFDAPDVIL